MQSASAAIRAIGLSKAYGETMALRELDLQIPRGQFFRLLGPNGSGKTTAVHALTTLIRPTHGRAEVAGHDVLRSGVAVRREIGIVFQELSLDPVLSVEETLLFAGRLRGLSRAQIMERSEILLALFGLADRRGQRVGSLSGGMRRALDITRSLLHRPRILFLDEPTLGLDVTSRQNIWRHIEQLRRSEQTTVFLTTHYLEEAQPCERVAFLSEGRIIEAGNPSELEAALGRAVFEIEADPEPLASVLPSLSEAFGPGIHDEGRALFRVRDPRIDVQQLLGSSRGELRSVRQRRPNLNDVFRWVNRPSRGEGEAR
jgi:ABC-2 type transport system ATP-binding protein